MSFARIVVLSMLAAFGVGAGYGLFVDADRPQITDAVPQETIQSAKILSTTPSLEAHEQHATPKLSDFRPYTICSGAIRSHCIVDGDTLWHDGSKIRIADIDTPEVSEPRCPSEAALGARATRRLLQLVNAGPFELKSWQGRDHDRYGRKLRVLVRDGRSLGDILVSEGLARTWTGSRRPWC